MNNKLILNTSYFGGIKKLNIQNPVSIARFKPNWFNGEEYEILSPSESLLLRFKKGIILEYDYIKEFNSYLNSLDINEVVKGLAHFYKDGYPITLVCYEKPNKFCHRHLVAKWLSKNLKYRVTEINETRN